MKAIRLHSHEGAGGLVYEDAPQPQPRDNEVLVQIYASGVTPAELGWGATWRTNSGIERQLPIPGHELSGIIVQVGAVVKDLKVGQEVYGLTAFDRDGSEAEYAIALPNELAPKPRTLDYVQAAAVPIGGLTAWQALFDHAHLTAGQTVLLHGAGGGVGTFFVQIAHWAGAKVIGVDAPQFRNFLLELGCDEVIDFTTTRFEDVIRDADIVIDMVGRDTVDRSWQVLKPNGILISLLKPPSQADAAAHGVRADFFVVSSNTAQLINLAELVDTGVLKPIISSVMPLVDAHQAYERRPAGAKPGKLVLQIID
jgi:NADPH:quinone reductase-like Zn-dependent oxidoreductase